MPEAYNNKIAILLFPYTCIAHPYIMQDWRKLECQEKGVPRPMGRSSHDAVCLGYGGDHPHLLVTGGLDNDKTVLGDAWMLDLQSGRWREVRITLRYNDTVASLQRIAIWRK